MNRLRFCSYRCILIYIKMVLDGFALSSQKFISQLLFLLIMVCSYCYFIKSSYKEPRYFTTQVSLDTALHKLQGSKSTAFNTGKLFSNITQKSHHRIPLRHVSIQKYPLQNSKMHSNSKYNLKLQLMSEDRYVFIVEWFDSAASLVRTYNLTYFLKDKSIEMFDLKNKRIFLKRCEYALQLKDIFLGAVLNVYSRQLKVVDYADEFTRTKFEVQKGKGLILITPDAYMSFGKIVNAVEEAGFSITNFKIAKLSKQQAERLYDSQRGKPYFNDLTSHLSSDLVLALEVLAQSCVNKLKELGSALKSKFGSDQIRCGVQVSQSASSAAKELQLFFASNSPLQSPAYFNNCSCLVIKPHLIIQNYVGQILDAVLSSGFEVSAAEMFWLDRPSAEEFLEVYKGVVPEYNQLVEQFTNGPCIALQVRQENVVPSLRELCGPHDPELARSVRPKSLRAVFGRDKAKNGVHCTDLAEDGILEVEYFFNILQKK